ncbi:hypothetical protein NAK66_005504 [Klebsiella oxytoca]
MKIELITEKQFIEQAECYYKDYMKRLLRNAPEDFYYFLNNKYNMNDIMESIIKKTRYHFFDDTDECRMNRVSGEVSYSKVKQHLRRLWVAYKFVYR